MALYSVGKAVLTPLPLGTSRASSLEQEAVGYQAPETGREIDSHRAVIQFAEMLADEPRRRCVVKPLPH